MPDYQKIWIPTSQGKLEGKLHQSTKTNMGIVIAHSFRNDFNELVCREAFNHFANQGYSVLAFNFTGHGNSRGNLSDLSYKRARNDFEEATKYFMKEGICRIGTYAISLGTIAGAVSQFPADANVFLSPTPLLNPKAMLTRYQKQIDSQKKEIEKRGYAILNSKSGRGKFRMGEKWIQEMKHLPEDLFQTFCKNCSPTLVLQGTNDNLADLEKTKNLSKIKNVEVILISGADHNFTDPSHRTETIEQASKFFKRCLAPN